MKKATMVWLIVAASLVLAGLLTVTCGLAMAQWDFSLLSSTKLETNTHEITEVYQNISVATDTADVVFIPCEGEKTSVVCHESVKETHRVEVRDGTLFIELVDTRKWYDYINVSFESASITVYLPQSAYGALRVKTDTGRVEIPEKFSLGTLEISTDTGDIVCDAPVAGDVKLQSDTGDVRFGGADAGAFSVQTSTGSVHVEGTKVSAGLAAKTSTGEITLDGVIAAGAMEITSSTGEVELSFCDASRLQIKTSTGEVEATLLSEKQVDADSSTGDVDVPRNGHGGACVIRTSTGDITVRFAS